MLLLLLFGLGVVGSPAAGWSWRPPSLFVVVLLDMLSPLATALVCTRHATCHMLPCALLLAPSFGSSMIGGVGIAAYQLPSKKKRFRVCFLTPHHHPTRRAPWSSRARASDAASSTIQHQESEGWWYPAAAASCYSTYGK